MKKQIVSANYKNRDSEYPWLIREEGASLSTAKAYKSVEASGVEFQRSDRAEVGFGCRIVAHCETAVGADPEPVEEKLKFNGRYDFLDTNNQPVKRVAKLRLTADREILATR